MANRLVNGVPVKDILNPLPDDPQLVERIAERKAQGPQLSIVEPDAKWPEYFEIFKSRIVNAFDAMSEGVDVPSSASIVSIEHVGSTAVPGLPAKAVIDIDLMLSSSALPFEAFYVLRLENAGFQFLLRESAWYEHRFFAAYEPIPILCNLHVWGPRCAEVERHRIFRDWLREHEADRELYARTKRGCAAASREKGEGLREYTIAKGEVIRAIMERACTELGYLTGD